MRSKQITDPKLGILIWNAHLLQWEGICTMVDGTSIPLYVNSLGYKTQIPAFDDAKWDRTITDESRKALDRVRRADGKLRAAVAKEYLPRYAKWNDGDRITARDFKRRLQLESVTLTPDGDAEVFFKDDGMFGGHALIAHLDPDGVVTAVELFG